MEDASMFDVECGSDDVGEQTIPTSLRRAEAERSLLRALLMDAVHCVLEEVGGSPAKRAELAADARAWVASRGDGETFSFENVCAWLDLPSDRLRRFLLEEVGNLRATAAAIARQGASRHPSALESRRRRERNARIRELRAAGSKPRDIAERFALSYASVIAICTEPATAEVGDAVPVAAAV
jgi:hypothetical protein